VLYFQFYYLPGYYRALLITGMILLTLVEVVRLYLGYVGNLKEKVVQTHILLEPPRGGGSFVDLATTVDFVCVCVCVYVLSSG